MCIKVCEELKAKLRQSPTMVAPDWSKFFGYNVETCQVAVEGTLTSLDHENRGAPLRTS